MSLLWWIAIGAAGGDLSGVSSSLLQGLQFEYCYEYKWG